MYTPVRRLIKLLYTLARTQAKAQYKLKLYKRFTSYGLVLTQFIIEIVVAKEVTLSLSLYLLQKK
jgi:hypothetical protein